MKSLSEYLYNNSLTYIMTSLLLLVIVFGCQASCCCCWLSSVGVSSLTGLQQKWIGTKRGQLYRIDSNGNIVATIDHGKQPIHSLVVDANLLFVGGSDRYVTIYNITTLDNNNNNATIVQRLGPHTGWVKSILLRQQSKNSSELYSIGCNRIEVWKSSFVCKYKHVKTISIENSPSLGATLSSDILCLSEWTDEYIAAGAVDGRIIVHNNCSSDLSTLNEFRAHDGRINAMTCQDGLLLSASHDGFIKCWLHYNDKWPVAELFLGTNVRITALAWNHSETNYFVFGTSQGLVGCAEVDVVSRIILVKKMQLVEDGNVIISALACDEESKMIVGHSKGLTILLSDEFIYSDNNVTANGGN